jgi:predicted alpha/beta hydrolase
MLAVLLLSTVLTAFDDIDGTNYGDWSKFCKENDDFNFENHGQCVSWYAQDDAAKAAQLYKNLDGTNDGDWSKFCKENDDFNFKNHGQCVSWHGQDDAAKAAQLCKDLDKVKFETGMMFKNHGQCQKWLKDNLPPQQLP